MKILSNFDTSLLKKLHKEYSDMYGEDRVMAIRKSRWYYYQHIGTPLFGYFLLLCIGFFVIYRYDTLSAWVEIAFWAVFLLLFVVLLGKTAHHYVDYKMDFLIVTPHEIIKYNQTGLFSRSTEKMHADKIKSISIQKSGVMNSLLDIGEIIFMSEGNDEQGDIEMDYVEAVEDKENKILHVLGMDTPTDSGLTDTV